MAMTNAKRCSIALVLSFLVPVLLAADPPSVVGRLNLVTGEVSFRPGSLDEWAPATINYPLTVGDHLWTDAAGRAELHVGSTAVRLDSNTEISFLNLDEQTVQLALSQGQLNVRLRQLEAGDTVEIDTPNSTITLLEPGSYSVDVQAEDSTSLTVWQGHAQATAATDEIDVPAGQTANVSGTGSMAYYLQPATSPGALDAWAASRDAREDRATSVRYVPREMIGAEDLDEHGTWTVMVGYGPVWYPTRVAPGWAPYRYGHWSWVSPWGWTWIDDAPWGFAPFHYGRWAFLNMRWVWVPGTMVARPVYAPALVVFVGGGPDSADGIGWFPLAPREVYVPPYGASTTYVQRINVTTVTITTQTIERIDVTQVAYVNRNVPTAVTMAPRQTFTQARPVYGPGVVVYNNDAIRRAPVLGMGATFGPQRESVIGLPPVNRNPPPQPPQHVRDRGVYTRITPAPAPAPFVPRGDSPPPRVIQPPPVQQVPPPVPPATRPGGRPSPVFVNPYVPRAPIPQPVPSGPQTRPGMVPQPVPQNPPVLINPQPRPGTTPQPAPRTPPRPSGMTPQPVPQRPGPVAQGPPAQPPQPQHDDRDRQPQQPQHDERDRQPQQPQQNQMTQTPQPGAVMQPAQRSGPQSPPVAAGPVQPKARPGEAPATAAVASGGSDARGLINTLRTRNLPDAEKRLAALRGKGNSQVDYASMSKRLQNARATLAAAEKSLAAGRTDIARQQALSAQQQIEEANQALAQADR